MSKFVMGIDPGFSGAFVFTNGEKIRVWQMPILKKENEKEIDFKRVLFILKNWQISHVFLERPNSGGQGSKSAFSYGRGFAFLEIAIRLSKLPMTLVEPAKWAKVMHEGISKDLKPKAKSLIAVRKLFPHLVDKLPANRNGVLLDGPVDALLIAGYGLKRMKPESEKEYDFL